MVQSARLYRLESSASFEELYQKLKKADVVEKRVIGKEIFNLKTIVKDISWESEKKLLGGTLLFEALQPLPQIDDTIKFFPVVSKIDFVFVVSSQYFIPFGNKFESENAAVKMNSILFAGKNLILKYFIPTNVVENFLQQNPCVVKRCTWKDLRIPGVDKASLGGPNIMQSTDPQRYDGLGLKKYVMIELQENGWVIGLSDIGSIIFFTMVERQKAIEFIRRRILPLIQQVQ